MDNELGTDTAITQAHPWHGVDPLLSQDALRVFIENAPFSLLKYEVDPDTGLLQIDHPLDTSALPPSAYGFVPRTLCGSSVAKLNARRRGDRAPLDVFVLSERPIQVPGVLAKVRVVGGVRVQDESYSDDKLIAVLLRDAQLGGAEDIADIPIHFIERICHFLSQAPLDGGTEVGDPFGRQHAEKLLAAAIQDYKDAFG